MRSMQSSAANPFVLMTNPEAVFAAIELSGGLAHLASRICRPLDKAPTTRADDETAAADEDLESMPEAEPESTASIV